MPFLVCEVSVRPACSPGDTRKEGAGGIVLAILALDATLKPHKEIEHEPFHEERHRQNQHKKPEILNQKVEKLEPWAAGVYLRRVRSVSDKLLPEGPTKHYPKGSCATQYEVAYDANSHLALSLAYSSSASASTSTSMDRALCVLLPLDLIPDTQYSSPDSVSK